MVDSFVVSSWQKRIIEFLVSNHAFSIKIIVLPDPPPRQRSQRARLLYKAFRRLDRTIFRVEPDSFSRMDMRQLVEDAKVIRVKLISSTNGNSLEHSVVEQIRDCRLDVLVRFGFGIIKGEILQAASHGVWSLHHGDSDSNRGGPPAFWEVVNREPVTGVTLQRLTSTLDGGEVLGKAYVRTDYTSFSRNQNSIFWAGVELFCSTLKNLADHGKVRSIGTFATRTFYSDRLFRNPGNGEALLIFFQFWFRKLGRAIRSLLKKQQWAIYYKRSKVGPEPVLYRYLKLKPPRQTDWADPFVVRQGSDHYIFIEEYFHSIRKGRISYLRIGEDGKLVSKKPTPVIDEAFHLSYPLVFFHEGSHYMTPETVESGSVWLYKCERFPTHWVRHKELLPGVSLCDPTPLLHNGIWYLFGTQKPFEGNSIDQYLHIYYTTDFLSGTWQAHPRNPVTRDVRGARPAGRIFSRNGKVVRPTQIGAPKYGYGIRLQEIVRLTPEEFEERSLEDILPNWKKSLLATHTFNYEDGLSVVDAQEGWL